MVLTRVFTVLSFCVAGAEVSCVAIGTAQADKRAAPDAAPTENKN
jgi:hypothetical protein